MTCSHTFPYWSVIPPTHCAVCGACLGCGAPAPTPQPWQRPYYPPAMPYQPWPTYPVRPYWSRTTVISQNTTGTPTVMS